MHTASVADAQALRNLRYRVTPLRDLHHRVTLELIAEIGLPHRRLLSSKLGPEASRNLGAIQIVGMPLHHGGSLRRTTFPKFDRF